MADYYDQYAGAPLFPVERAVSRVLGVDPAIYDYAANRPADFGFKNDPPGSKGYEGALRHILLAGELQRMNPTVANPLLLGHEFISGALYGQPAQFREMDLFNNSLGRALGRKAKSREELELLALTNLPWARVVKPMGYQQR